MKTKHGAARRPRANRKGGGGDFARIRAALRDGMFVVTAKGKRGGMKLCVLAEARWEAEILRHSYSGQDPTIKFEVLPC